MAAAKASPLSPNPATANQQLVCIVDGVTLVPTVLVGWSLIETTGSAAAKIRLRDGLSVAGPELKIISLPSGTSSEISGGADQIQNGGIFVEVVSGSVEGSITWA